MRAVPVLARVIDTFEQCLQVGQIVIVVAAENMERCQRLVAEQGWPRVTGVCPGGAWRQDSVAAGLKLLKDCDWVIIHDGARPLVTRELIERGLAEAGQTGAAVAAVPVTALSGWSDAKHRFGTTTTGVFPEKRMWSLSLVLVSAFTALWRLSLGWGHVPIGTVEVGTYTVLLIVATGMAARLGMLGGKLVFGH